MLPTPARAAEKELKKEPGPAPIATTTAVASSSQPPVPQTRVEPAIDEGDSKDREDNKDKTKTAAPAAASNPVYTSACAPKRAPSTAGIASGVSWLGINKDRGDARDEKAVQKLQ